MALIHEKLYEAEDLAKINFAEYVEELANNLYSAYAFNSNTLTLKLDVEDIFLDIDRAIPCGLIVNELVSNSLKHAFSDGESGETCVELQLINNNIALIVSDNGVGIPEDFSLENTNSLGLQLVDALTSQLEGRIELNRNKPGVEFKLTFAK